MNCGPFGCVTSIVSLLSIKLHVRSHVGTRANESGNKTTLVDFNLHDQMRL